MTKEIRETFKENEVDDRSSVDVDVTIIDLENVTDSHH
jgi:hypothetical protein